MTGSGETEANCPRNITRRWAATQCRGQFGGYRQAGQAQQSVPEI